MRHQRKIIKSYHNGKSNEVSKVVTYCHITLYNPTQLRIERIQMPSTIAPIARPVTTFRPRSLCDLFFHCSSSTCWINFICSCDKPSLVGSILLAYSASMSPLLSFPAIFHVVQVYKCMLGMSNVRIHLLHADSNVVSL